MQISSDSTRRLARNRVRHIRHIATSALVPNVPTAMLLGQLIGTDIGKRKTRSHQFAVEKCYEHTVMVLARVYIVTN